MRKRKTGKGIAEYLQKENIGAVHSNPTREVNIKVDETMLNEYKSIGAVPPKDQPINLQGTTTLAEQGKGIEMVEDKDQGAGGFALYTDSDTKIRPLHPAFHPVPYYALRPELLQSM